MRIKQRYLENQVEQDALAAKKMAFISGPRQVGKTTLAKNLLKVEANYFNWDMTTFRRKWAKDPTAIVHNLGPGPVVLDELHKYRFWKRSLKGLYDQFGNHLPLIVTGSARLDLFRKGGDSLLGRYLPYRLHPFSVAEAKDPKHPDELEPTKSRFPLKDLLRFSGFPEPLLTGDQGKARRWSRLRMERILMEDVRDLRAVANLSQLQLMVDLLPTKIGAPLSLNSLREDLEVAYGTVRSWIQLLNSLYIIFSIQPYAKNIKRSLKAEKKIYLFDPLMIEQEGAALENTIALHLLKACHYWTDTAQGHFELFYVRTKEKEEVDFCICRDKKVWMLVECKSSDIHINPHLIKFTRLLKPRFAFQAVRKKGFDRQNLATGIRIIDAERFLSMLV